MKQHITVEQLTSLTFDTQIKTANMLSQRVKIDNAGDEILNLEWLARKITIGKMIEILQKHHMLITKYVNWAVVIAIKEKEHTFESEELCDALWEAVKEAL